RYGFEIRDDRIDLCGLEMIFEAGHAGRAVADDLAHHRFLPAQRTARQFGTVERAHHLWLGVAYAARLIEQPHAEELSVIEGLIAARGLCRRDQWRHHEQEKDRRDLAPCSKQPHN